MDATRITHLEIDGQDVTAHIRTEPDEAPVCHAYAPPTGKPEDSGYCARCGMYDWRHGEQPEEPTESLRRDPDGIYHCPACEPLTPARRLWRLITQLVRSVG